MYRFYFLVNCLLVCVGVSAQLKTGDTVGIWKREDSLTIWRVDTLAAPGLINSTTYYPNGRVYCVGKLTADNRPYADRQIGEWIFLDTGGVLNRRVKYKDGDVLFYSWHHYDAVDSTAKISTHRSETYFFRDGRLRTYSKSRYQWISAGYRHILFDLGITSECRGAESQMLDQSVYDSTGRLTRHSTYWRGRVRRCTIITDTSTTVEKSTLRHHLFRTVKRDSNNVIRSRTRLRRHSEKRRNFYHSIKREESFYSNGRLKSRYTDHRFMVKTIKCSETGKKISKDREGRNVDSHKKWTENGRRKSAEREINFLFIHHYVRKTWDDTTRKKSVTHRKPPRVW